MHRVHKLYNDRDSISDLPDAVASVLRKERLVTASGEKVSYCGLILAKNEVAVFFPRMSPAAPIHNSIPLLMGAIRKYHSTHNSGHAYFEDGDSVLGGDSLSLIFQILEDFRRNGLYSRRRTVRTRNVGKPDWKRTISKVTPFKSAGHLVYLDFHGGKRCYESDSEVSRIHAYIIKVLDSEFNVFLESNFVYSVDGIPDPAIKKKEFFLTKLRAELKDVYSDRDIRLLKLLIKYIEQERGHDEVETLFGIKHFHYVWEYMLRQVLANTVNINSELPIPAYRSRDGALVPAASKGQVTDIVIKHPSENKYNVVDAKYYGATSISNSPGWPDLVKQFFYAKALKFIYPSSTVTNSFIFPGVEGCWKSAHMIDRDSGSIMDTEYQLINCIYVAPSDVIDSFVHNKKLIDLSDQLLGI